MGRGRGFCAPLKMFAIPLDGSRLFAILQYMNNNEERSMKQIQTEQPENITWRLEAAGIDHEVLRPVSWDEYEDAGSQGYQGPTAIELDEDAAARWDAAAKAWQGRKGGQADRIKVQLPILIGDADPGEVAAHVDAVVAWLADRDDNASWTDRLATMPRWTR